MYMGEGGKRGPIHWGVALSKKSRIVRLHAGRVMTKAKETGNMKNRDVYLPGKVKRLLEEEKRYWSSISKQGTPSSSESKQRPDRGGKRFIPLICKVVVI